MTLPASAGNSNMKYSEYKKRLGHAGISAPAAFLSAQLISLTPDGVICREHRLPVGTS